jgi:uncharacterized damage-inducible protein DinB
MKRCSFISKAFTTVTILSLAAIAFPLTLCAQQTADSPVTAAAAHMLAGRQKNLAAAAEEMPEGKYGFSPTPQQMTFGHLVAHIATSNYFLCSKLSGSAAPQEKVAEKESKAKLTAALNKSFDYCSGVLGKLKDSQLSDPVELWGGMKTTKAGALLDLTSDWADHYAAAAMYLRLNGLLPPTAKGKE